MFKEMSMSDTFCLGCGSDAPPGSKLIETVLGQYCISCADGILIGRKTSSFVRHVDGRGGSMWS